MGSLFSSTLNTRALPVDSMRYIRSDVPLNLTKEEILWLMDNNITTLVDLRSEQELKLNHVRCRKWKNLLITICR